MMQTTIQLSDRVKAIKPSSTLAVTAKSKAMKAQGIDVVGFGAGEPDFDTPPFIKEAAKKALDEGKTKYEPTSGTPQAREAIARYMQRQHGFESVTAENVILSVGGKHALYVAFMCVLNEGDEVLLPAPYWVSYPEQARLAGATVREIPASVDNDFKITPQQLEEAITPRSRVLVLNSPGNPTGTMYSPAELKALAEVVARHEELMVFADDIYERLVYGPEPFVSFATLPGMMERTVTFNCLSKAYAMTGWRIGYTVAPRELIKAMDTLQGQMTSNITSFSYPAVVAALDGPQDAVEEMRKAFAERGAHMHERLSRMPGVKCPRPTGAFYVFPDVSAHFGKTDPTGRRIDTAAAFAESLLEQARVAVVPGEDFGGPNHVRLSFATSMEQIDKGLDRIEEYLGGLK